jgi:hypothetical protein
MLATSPNSSNWKIFRKFPVFLFILDNIQADTSVPETFMNILNVYHLNLVPFGVKVMNNEIYALVLIRAYSG